MPRDATIKPNQRVALIGKTGSGKTYLEQQISLSWERFVVFDAKGTIPLKGWNLEEGSSALRQLRNGHSARIRVRESDPRKWLSWLDLIWQLHNVVLYIDEMSLVNPSTNPSLELRKLYQQGRELGVGVHASTQRPRNVPAIMFSEADWIFAFRMSRAEDRKTVADYGDEKETMRKPIRDPHGFYTYSPSWETAIYTPRYVANRQHAKTPKVRVA